jgi:ferredoxin
VKRFGLIILAVMIFFVFLFFICMRFVGDSLSFGVSIIYSLFLSSIFFLMLKSGKVSRYRRPLFILWAILFCVAFISELLETRGSVFLYDEDIKNLQIPMCHIVIHMAIVPAILKRLLIFPTPILAEPPYGLFPLFFIWIVATLAIGRGFCSFLCFFGGWDELFSKIAKRPRIGLSLERFRIFPFLFCAVLIVLSYLFLKPLYCIWFCPFKAVTEFPEPNTIIRIAQTAIFISLFLGLVIILPILTRKRTQCGLFCPFGAFQSVVGVVSLYRVKKDRERCALCGRCEGVCPVFAVKKGEEPMITCVRCGECMDVCPNGALNYKIVCTSNHGLPAKILFLFTAVMLFGIFSSEFAIKALVRIISWW